MNKTLNANVWRLVIAQALAGANTTVIYATGALIGNSLAPSKLMATLPISLFVAGMAVITLPAGALAVRFGRRFVFLLGALSGVVLGLLAALAIVHSSFSLFCLAMPFGGAYAATVLTFRFAAAESVPDRLRSQALSLVMAGGILAGVVGPQLVIHTMDAIPRHAFAATYIASAIVALMSVLVLAGISIDRPQPGKLAEKKSFWFILKQPKILVSVVSGAISYMLMNFLMTSAPLAMKICGLSIDSASLGLQWHVIAMYAPGFISGRLVSRWGSSKIVFLGFLLTGMAAFLGMLGSTISHFWISLIFLGAGWNLSFVGASSMLMEAHTNVEKAYIQSLNDFVVFGSVMIGSFLSGGLLSRYGWPMICFLALFLVVLAVLFIVIASRTSRSEVLATE